VRVYQFRHIRVLEGSTISHVHGRLSGRGFASLDGTN